MLLNALLLALRAIRRNLMRSFLTVLGIVIGVAAVITMVTLGNGATRMVSDQISSLGSNLLILRPGQHLGPGRDSAGAAAFKLADVDALETQVPSLKAVAPVVGSKVTLVAGAQNWQSQVSGTSNAYFTAGNWKIDSGRSFEDDEEAAGKAVCVIGATVKKQLFNNASPLGDDIRVKNFACQIIGTLAAKGQGAMGQDQDDVVLMPIRTAQRRRLLHRVVHPRLSRRVPRRARQTPVRGVIDVPQHLGVERDPLRDPAPATQRRLERRQGYRELTVPRRPPITRRRLTPENGQRHPVGARSPQLLN